MSNRKRIQACFLDKRHSWEWIRDEHDITPVLGKPTELEVFRCRTCGDHKRTKRPAY